MTRRSPEEFAADHIEKSIERARAVEQARAAVAALRDAQKLRSSLTASEEDVARLARVPAAQAARMAGLLDAIRPKLLAEVADMGGGAVAGVTAGLDAAAMLIQAVVLGDVEARARIDTLRAST